jgi:hypothetical protein
LKYACFLLMAIFCSGMRISVPGMPGTLSLNFVFVLFGLVDLSATETVMLGVTVTLVQCLWNRERRARPAIAITEQVYRSRWLADNHVDPAIRLAVATCVLFFLNTLPVALVISLAEERIFASVWRECYFWSLPYYLGGAAVAQALSAANKYVGWPTVLLTGPVIYLIYRSYRLYLERLEEEKKHVEDVSSLHLRTIEALALAIEAKDHTTHGHLQRVQVYATEIAKDLGLSEDNRNALRAAALLHDRPPDAGRVREDEDSPSGGRGDSGARQVSLSGGPHRPRASRKVGRQRVSLRIVGRKYSHRRAHSFSSGLPGRAGHGSPVSPRTAPRRSDESRRWRIRQGL